MNFSQRNLKPACGCCEGLGWAEGCSALGACCWGATGGMINGNIPGNAPGIKPGPIPGPDKIKKGISNGNITQNIK